MSLKVSLDIDLGGEWVEDTTLEAMIKEVIRDTVRSSIKKLVAEDTEIKKRIRENAIKILNKGV